MGRHEATVLAESGRIDPLAYKNIRKLVEILCFYLEGCIIMVL